MSAARSCTCSTCQSYCRHRPGIFMPEQVPAIERHFGKKIEAMLGEELVFDYWMRRDGSVLTLMLMPNIKHGRNGKDPRFMPANPVGECVFLKDGRCQIEGIKPFECAMAMHTDPPGRGLARKKRMKTAWAKIRRFSRLTKQVPEVDLGDAIDAIFGGNGLLGSLLGGGW